ncbi:MAG TPA: selenocysteine-specific translation elongation factor [Pseudomonadales bacterium]
MIVTLAGHVDHGKTSLIRQLTGKDTDRLAEEKRRGLTIDLGFAYLDVGGVTLGFVDVPGHHRFIHNMVAGVAALQHALLVVAADDGPMPQSREHLQILELLGLRDGVVALTKCDRVAGDRLAAAHAEVQRLVTGTFLREAPVIVTSAVSGDGLDSLRTHLVRAAERHAVPGDGGAFRLAVDRAFLLKGVGLVVTGMVHAGTLQVDEELHVFPGGARGRVRDLRVQDRPSGLARPGDRAAINLAGVDPTAVRRGHWLCAVPEAGSRSLIVDLRVLGDFPRPVRHWLPVHAYLATSHARGRLALLESNRLEPGERGLAEVVLDEPLPGKLGDRLILRDQALERTLGGGAVLDNRPPAGRRRSPARLRAVRAWSQPTATRALAAALADGPVDLAAFADLWNLTPAQAAELRAGADAVAQDGTLVARPTWERWRGELLDECRTRHRIDPTLQGLQEHQFQTDAPARFRGALLGELIAAGALERRAGRYFPRDHRAELSDAERRLLERLRPHLDREQPASLGDIARSLGLPLTSLRNLVAPLVSKGWLVQIGDKRLFLPDRLKALAAIACALSDATAGFSAREFRDASGVGRNVVIEVLEYFDARGFTRRHGETRTVVGETSRLLPAVR